MADSIEEYAKGGAADTNGLGIANVGASKANDASETDNKFQQAVGAWRSLDLTKLVSSLDTTASELVTQQKDSMVQRKELAQKTKDFRKLEDEQKLGEIKDLLKAYQAYVDVLTNHNKTINAAFMQAYSPLSEAPDPYPLLEASIDSLVTSEEVVPRLEKENEELKKQNTKLNGQLEETEQQLEAERTKRQSFEGNQDSKIKEVEESWSAVLKEKEDNWTAKETSLEEKVEGQERLLKELKASYEVSQRLEKSGEDAQQDAGRNAAAAAELEIVSGELERANLRLADIEARNEQLRMDLAQTASQAKSTGRNSNVEDDPAFLRLRSENTSLLRKLDSARYDKESEKSGLETKLRSVEREAAAARADRDALQTKVQKLSDYDEIKRELDMLRAIEFATVSDSDLVDVDDSSRTNGKPTGGSESLEQLLLARNKKLSNEITEFRVSHNELQQRLDALQEDLSGANMELEKSRNLNEKLENDLQKTQQEASNAFETMSVAGTWTSRHPAKSAYGSRRGHPGGGTSPTSSIIGGFDPASSYSGSGSPRGGGDSPAAGQGILPMVTAQRDRFKKKISELESELQKQYQTVSSLRSEIASLQRDNLNLYEKTRYVSSYASTRPTAAGSGAAYGSNPNPSTISVASPSEDRYRSAYESNLSPFAAFRGRESARALKRMSLPERAVFQITRMVLATRTSRNLFAVYCLGLHLLVLMMLWWMASADVEQHGNLLNEGVGAAAGVAAVGAGSGVGGSGGGGGGSWEREGFDSGQR